MEHRFVSLEFVEFHFPEMSLAQNKKEIMKKKHDLSSRSFIS